MFNSSQCRIVGEVQRITMTCYLLTSLHCTPAIVDDVQNDIPMLNSSHCTREGDTCTADNDDLLFTHFALHCTPASSQCTRYDIPMLNSSHCTRVHRCTRDGDACTADNDDLLFAQFPSLLCLAPSIQEFDRFETDVPKARCKIHGILRTRVAKGQEKPK